MALARKPKGSAQPTVDVDALINKGGGVATAKVESEKAGKDVTPVIVRLPTSMNSRIETARQGRAVVIPRHTWILEAIAEKLEREGY